MTQENVNKDTEPAESAPEATTNQSNDRSYLSHIVEGIMTELGVPSFDSRTSHMLVDLLQREALTLMRASVENSEKRLSVEREKLLCGTGSSSTWTKPNMNVTEEDAQLACQEYINNNVVQPGILRDLLEVQKYANNVRLGAKPYTPGPKQKHFASYRGEDEFGQFPTGQIPYLPENATINTLLPHWDIELKHNKK